MIIKHENLQSIAYIYGIDEKVSSKPVNFGVSLRFAWESIATTRKLNDSFTAYIKEMSYHT